MYTILATLVYYWDKILLESIRNDRAALHRVVTMREHLSGFYRL